MEIKNESGKLVMYFEHHPGLKGVLLPMGENKFLCTYSDPVYGVKQIPFTVKDKKVMGATVTVNDFVDFTEYEFTKG